MDITLDYTNYCYNNYYRKSIDWDKQNEIWAEKEDEAWEDIRDNNFEEEN